MDIIWHGHSCFELVSGGYSAVIDPFQDTSVGTAYPHVRLTADAVYISHEDRDHNFREGVTLRSTGKANPFAVTELETYHDIMRGRLRGMNTVASSPPRACAWRIWATWARSPRPSRCSSCRDSTR